jgi:hypothetical protein
VSLVLRHQISDTDLLPTIDRVGCTVVSRVRSGSSAIYYNCLAIRRRKKAESEIN